MDARKRFMNQREAMMLWSNGSTTAADTLNVGGEFNKSEGYFAAIEDRGIVAALVTLAVVPVPTLAELDDIILAR